MLTGLVRRLRAWFSPPPSAAETRFYDAVDVMLADVTRMRKEHERWQRNYKAGRYWGDDGDAEPLDDSRPH